MSRLLRLLFGRQPIGWLQLRHSKGRLAAAVAGVAFADMLVFVQLGIMGALNSTIVQPYEMFHADIVLSASDANTFTDGGNIARQRMFQALGTPGVAKATALFSGLTDWQTADGESASLRVYGIDPLAGGFLSLPGAGGLERLQLQDTVILDSEARGITSGSDKARTNASFEFNGRALSVVDTVEVGGGFGSDGVMFVSDQTFLRLFPNRSAGAANRILISVGAGLEPRVIAERLRAAMPTDEIRVQSFADAAKSDLSYQTTQRPTGIIFGFGVFMGILVGFVIVYQVLSTDVADHLKEYATFKAIGYGHGFFLGIVFEEALILAVFGFIPGLLIAIGFYYGLSSASGLPVAMDVPRAIVVFLGTLFASSLSGAVATRRLTAADPADLF